MNMNDKKALPWSGQRYYLDNNGSVFDYNGKELDLVINDNLRCVKLIWILGSRYYPISLLLLLTYDDLQLPTRYWDDIIYFYTDGDNGNLSLSNTEYVFTKPLESDAHPTYYHIPKFEHYGLNVNGAIINLITGKRKIWSITKDVGGRKGGYRYCRLHKPSGVGSGHLRHRLYCLVFKPIFVPPSTMVVNHINGIKGDDVGENVEWCTYHDNNQHAIDNSLRTDGVVRVLVKDTNDDNAITSFISIACASREYGINVDSIRSRLTKTANRLYDDGLLFKIDDGSPWPEVSSKVYLRPGRSTIKVLNVFTGEILIFSNPTDASKVLGIRAAVIMLHLRDKQVIPFNGYNFKLLTDDSEWPAHTNYHLEVYKATPSKPANALFITDITTGEEVFYPTIKQGSDAIACTVQQLRCALSKSKKYPIYRKRYKLKSFKLKENLIQCPASQ